MAIIKRKNGNTPALSSWLDNFWDSGSFFDDDLIRNSSPAVNVKENDNSYEIELAAPGMKKDEMDISIENGVLTISGVSKKEEEEKGENFTRREFSYSSFKRSFAVPEDVNEEDVKAKYEDGVLKITLTKTGEKKPKGKSIAVE